MGPVREVLQRAVTSGLVPGAVALIRHRGAVVFHEAFGYATVEPEARPMTRQTRFDLASLTKPLIGAGVALALVDRGVLSLDEEVTGFLPELGGLAGKGITFRRLLSHTSGLTGWRPLYTWAHDRKGILETVDRLGLTTAPGSRHEYSDLGFITLGLALERAGAQPLDELATELVFAPLDLTGTGYRPSPSPGDFAVTERGNAFERRMAEWAGLSFEGWRTDFYPGEVNDGNAHYGLGGVSAHAGVFSNAHDVGVLGEMWLGKGSWEGHRVLSRATVHQATIEQTNDAGRGLGWVLMKQAPPTLEELSRLDSGLFPPTRTPWSPRPSGELMSSTAFGHTGFTGTSIWIDPTHEVVAVLLTNATHPEVDIDKPLNGLRARFHNAAIAAICSSDS